MTTARIHPLPRVEWHAEKYTAEVYAASDERPWNLEASRDMIEGTWSWEVRGPGYYAHATGRPRPPEVHRERNGARHVRVRGADWIRAAVLLDKNRALRRVRGVLDVRREARRIVPAEARAAVERGALAAADGVAEAGCGDLTRTIRACMHSQ